MADQQNRGGKKHVDAKAAGAREQHQGVREPDEEQRQEGLEGVPERPAPGQPGGPKPNLGKTRPTD